MAIADLYIPVSGYVYGAVLNSVQHTKSFMPASDFKRFPAQVVNHLGDTSWSSGTVVITDIASHSSLHLFQCCDEFVGLGSRQLRSTPWLDGS